MKEIENLKQVILKDYQRLSPDDKMVFACHPGVPCFNSCCGDVNIFLTPYDIIRLKHRLGITSMEFLERYTILPFDVHQAHPVVLLRMEADERKTCPFVSAGGCTVYEDRPWACRMYPLGKASALAENGSNPDDFYFILEEDVCKGFSQSNQWLIRDWLESQKVKDYDDIGDLFKEISLHKFFSSGRQLNPQKMEMFHMVCYDVDRFRAFVFGSSFLQRYDISGEILEAIEKDDTELLKFGFDWLRFSLFEEWPEVIKIRKTVS